jgi:hypothetical protein
LGEKEFIKYLDKNSNDRIRVYLFVEKGNIKDVILQFKSLIQGKWHSIVRYDCAHVFFHRDEMFPDGTKDKQVIEFKDLDTALPMLNKI